MLCASQAITFERIMADRRVSAFAVALVLLVALGAAPELAECVGGVVLDPCTPEACTEVCRKILGDKYQSSSCTIYSHGKLCICL